MTDTPTEAATDTAADISDLAIAKRDQAALRWFALGVIVGAALAIGVLTLRGSATLRRGVRTTAVSIATYGAR